MQLSSVKHRLRIRHLAVLVSIGRHQNGYAAAKELHLTQPAISKALKEIEEIFGIALFHTGRSGTFPNRVGDALIHRAATILNQLHAAELEIKQISAGMLGTLRLGVIPFCPPDLLNTALARLAAKDVRIQIKLEEDTTAKLVDRLIARKLDCVIGRYSHVYETALKQSVLYKQRFVVVAGIDHPVFMAKPSVNIRDTTKYSWVVPPPHTAARTIYSNLFLNANVNPPTIQIETGSLQTMKSAMQQNGLIGILPAQKPQAFHKENLRPLPIDISNQAAPLILITNRNDALMPTARLFYDAIHEAKAGINPTLDQYL